MERGKGMPDKEFQVVTGAFGFLGKYIARILVERGKKVKTLTGHPTRPNPFGNRVEAVRFSFDEPAILAEDLEGAETVFNTYWIRFGYGRLTFELAVENSQKLIRAAVEAGVKRFVHISITNPAEDSPFPYFRGKAAVERTLEESGLSYAIVRPTVLFGREDILFNNIAWLLRRFPVFVVFGGGDYRIQPVYVGDVAELAVEASGRKDNMVCDAAGPEVYIFEELVRLMRRIVKSRARIVHIKPSLVHLATGIINPLVRDVIITRDELYGLMTELLVSGSPSLCPTRFSEWLEEHVSEEGSSYASELKRHYR
jgi:NADH dehydrogenase